MMKKAEKMIKMLEVINRMSEADKRMTELHTKYPEVMKEYDSIIDEMDSIKTLSEKIIGKTMEQFMNESGNDLFRDEETVDVNESVQFRSKPHKMNGLEGSMVDIGVNVANMKTETDCDIATADIMRKIEVDTGMDRHSDEFTEMGNKINRELKEARFKFIASDKAEGSTPPEKK